MVEYEIEFKLAKHKEADGFIGVLKAKDKEPQEEVLKRGEEYYSKLFKTPVKATKKFTIKNSKEG